MASPYVNGIYTKSTRQKLCSARRLAESLLVAIEGEEFSMLQGQSMDMLKTLLRILCEAIRMYERERQGESKKGRKPESRKA